MIHSAQHRSNAPGSTSVPARPERIRILGQDQADPALISHVKDTANRAVDFFQSNFGPVPDPLTLDIGNQSQSAALRTGYNVQDHIVHFPGGSDLIDAGLRSDDVVNHEIFHALVCQAYPNLPVEGEAEALHEALADYFAYLLHPDESFGEDYQIGKPHLRQYHNDYSIKLAAGSHAKGNAITSLLLKYQIQPQEIREFLTRGDFSLQGLGGLRPDLHQALEVDSSFELVSRVANYPESAIHRYRISPEKPLSIDFVPNAQLLQQHPRFKIEWVPSKPTPSVQYRIGQVTANGFTVEPSSLAEPEKFLAVAYDAEKVIGFQPFYFAVSGANESARTSAQPQPIHSIVKQH